MHYLYILKSKETNKYYIGETGNLEKRFEEHKVGKTSFGKRNRDIELAFRKEFENKGKARKLENFLKRQKSHKFIDRLISGEIEIPL